MRILALIFLLALNYGWLVLAVVNNPPASIRGRGNNVAMTKMATIKAPTTNTAMLASSHQASSTLKSNHTSRRIQMFATDNITPESKQFMFGGSPFGNRFGVGGGYQGFGAAARFPGMGGVGQGGFGQAAFGQGGFGQGAFGQGMFGQNSFGGGGQGMFGQGGFGQNFGAGRRPSFYGGRYPTVVPPGYYNPYRTTTTTTTTTTTLPPTNPPTFPPEPTTQPPTTEPVLQRQTTPFMPFPYFPNGQNGPNGGNLPYPNFLSSNNNNFQFPDFSNTNTNGNSNSNNNLPFPNFSNNNNIANVPNTMPTGNNYDINYNNPYNNNNFVYNPTNSGASNSGIYTYDSNTASGTGGYGNPQNTFVYSPNGVKLLRQQTVTIPASSSLQIFNNKPHTRVITIIYRRRTPTSPASSKRQH